MRILRLSNSNDVLDDIPVELRAAAVAEQVVRDATGEAVETITRVVWPGPELPGIVGVWLERYQPDVVFLRAPAYWVNYESLPLRLERRLGGIGKWPSQIGLKVGGNPTFAASRAGRALRKLLVRTLGGDTYFTPREATDYVAAVLRVVLASESVIPAVRGPGQAIDSSATAKGFQRATRRVDAFDRNLAALCVGLHVPYASVRAIGHQAAFLRADEVHDGPEGQRLYGQIEGQLIAQAWAASGARPHSGRSISK